MKCQPCKLVPLSLHPKFKSTVAHCKNHSQINSDSITEQWHCLWKSISHFRGSMIAHSHFNSSIQNSFKLSYQSSQYRTSNSLTSTYSASRLTLNFLISKSLISKPSNEWAGSKATHSATLREVVIAAAKAIRDLPSPSQGDVDQIIMDILLHQNLFQPL